MPLDHDSSETATDGRSSGAGRIVVGVDGSQGSRAALEWAIREAQVHASSVHILVVWQYPQTTSGSAWGLGMDPLPDVQEVVAAASAAAASRLGLRASEQGDVATTWEAMEGNPASALLAASEDADLLVVGSRGHGAFVGALLGSVSHQVVAHAHCPVVVVPTPPAVIRKGTGMTTPAIHRLSETGNTITPAADDIRGRTVKDKNGEAIGKVHDLLIEDQERKIRFLLVEHSGFLGFGHTVSSIPVDAITKISEHEVAINHSREHVAAAPPYDPELIADSKFHGRIYSHYGHNPFWDDGYVYPANLPAMLAPH